MRDQTALATLHSIFIRERLLGFATRAMSE